jgi:ABC-type antimicrobial peptide transport system permease subunit
MRGKGAPEQTRRNLEAAFARSPGAVQGTRVAQLQETIDWETYPQQAASWLSTLLGLVALLLTVTGIYGVMSYLVSGRTKEIGIRMALGATRGQLARFILTYSARLAGAGLTAGTVLAAGLLQYIASTVDLMVNLYDIPAYFIPLAVVAVAGLLAALGPTKRACRVDPLDALRAD